MIRTRPLQVELVDEPFNLTAHRAVTHDDKLEIDGLGRASRAAAWIRIACPFCSMIRPIFTSRGAAGIGAGPCSRNIGLTPTRTTWILDQSA